jgi:hypothetical protein
MFHRSRIAHIGIEILEPMPSLTHSNPSSPISMVILGIYVPASIDHSRPDAVYPRSFHPMRLIGDTACIPLQAATTFNPSILQQVPNSNNGLATIAQALPSAFTVQR